MSRAMQTISIFVVSAFLAGLLAGNVAAQNAPMTFRVPNTPNPLGQPFIGQDGFVSPAAMVPAPPLAAADRRYSDFSGTEMKRMIVELVAISLKDRNSGNVYWGRNIGTQGHAEAEDWTLGNSRNMAWPMFTKRCLISSSRSGRQNPTASILVATDRVSNCHPRAHRNHYPHRQGDSSWISCRLGLGTEADFTGA